VAEADGAVRCCACAHRGLIRPGRTGICGVRAVRAGALVSLVFGRAVSAAQEPIEKKPLFHFYPGSTAFSIATAGCNFHCLHCQNWEISQAGRAGGRL
jgi:pyruvate formate lyase activating enzyme